MIEALKQLGVNLNNVTGATDVTGIDGVFDNGLNQLTLDLGNAGVGINI